MRANSTSNETLLGALRRGDRRAGGALVKRLARSVTGVCWALSGDVGLTEEAAQETWRRVLSGLDTFDGNREARPWILAIARNTMREILRRRRPATPLGAVDEPQARGAPDRPAIEHERGVVVAGWIGELPPVLREAAVLKYGLDLPNAEIEQVLGITRDALWARLSRARRALRRRHHGDL